MASASVSDWNPSLRGLLSRYRQNSGPDGCIHSRRFWRKWRRGTNSISLAGSLYCLDQCLERAILKQLRRLPVATSHPTNHRIPLGLVLLSKKQITPEQLRTALDAQRSAGRGRIGEWLQELGFVNERQVTASFGAPVVMPNLSRRPLTFGIAKRPPNSCHAYGTLCDDASGIHSSQCNHSCGVRRRHRLYGPLRD